MPGPRLYGEFASWFHALTHPDDYVEEANIFRVTMEEHARQPIHTVLELGCGGGNNASHLKAHYAMTLTDLSPEMVEVSRGLNPECEHIQGDMRSLRLGRTFDAVFVHDAIAYMTTEQDLEAAMRTAYEHLGPDGIALFVPDDTTESFKPGTEGGGHDLADRSLRYESWESGPKPGETSYETFFTFVLREGDSERIEHDTHVIGLFPRATWERLLEDVGFEVRVIPFRHSSFAPNATHEMFVGLKR